jgi:hypothetical protein
MNEALDSLPVEGERKWKAVYTIVERPGLQKKLWVRVGTAFPNRDQSMNVKLDAVPTNGTLHIRDYEPFPDGREGQGELRPRRAELPPFRAEGGLR